MASVMGRMDVFWQLSMTDAKFEADDEIYCVNTTDIRLAVHKAAYSRIRRPGLRYVPLTIGEGFLSIAEAKT